MSNALRSAPEPIAIIGIGSRFPGAPDADELWKAIDEGRDCTTDFPGGRSPVPLPTYPFERENIGLAQRKKQ